MEVSVICYKCKEAFSFDAEAHHKVFFKKWSPETPEIFVKRCPHCGTLNEVKVPVKVKK